MLHGGSFGSGRLPVVLQQERVLIILFQSFRILLFFFFFFQYLEDELITMIQLTIHIVQVLLLHLLQSLTQISSDLLLLPTLRDQIQQRIIHELVKYLLVSGEPFICKEERSHPVGLFSLLRFHLAWFLDELFLLFLGWLVKEVVEVLRDIVVGVIT